MTSQDPCLIPATELLVLYRSRDLSPVEVTAACFARIREANPAINAFFCLTEEEAMAAARAAEARWAKGAPQGAIDGVPVTIKDLTMMAGAPYRRGSVTTDPDEIWAEDAPATQRLREAGGVILGKTTTPEFGWKGVTDCALTGITRNPWDPTKTPGGSSGGASGSVALGMGALALGTDGGGSVRMPAGFTGVFGLYPTAGRIPYVPPSTMDTASQIGPLTRTVADGALMFSVMARPDPRDSIGLTDNERDWSEGIEKGVKGLRIAWSPTLGFADCDPAILDATAAAARRFEDLGAVVEQVDHVIDDPREPYETIYRVAMARILRTIPAEAHKEIDPGLRRMAEEGEGIGTFEHAAALSTRAAWGAKFNAFFENYDLLVSPQLPLTAFEAGLEYPEGQGMTRWFDWSPYCYPLNFTNVPAGTMPCGFVGGLPIALQIAGPRYREDLIFRACRAFETVCPIALPGIPKPAPGSTAYL
ncbi:MAG: amidase [Rhodospirillaceae bacterium]|nr:amidase [Rhodospirillaceae bacterium]MBT6119736.1 amidase [Rhodospirillaceae bacterium]